MIRAGVCINVCGPKKNNLNRILAIDSPFQTFAIVLLVEFILLSPETLSSSKSRIFLYNAHLALFGQRMT